MKTVFLLALGFIFTVGQNRTALAAPERTGILNHADAEGEVIVDPFFEWIDEEKTKFRMSWSVKNESSIPVPGTEISFSLPKETGLKFNGTYGFSGGRPGNYSLDILQKEQTEAKLWFSDFKAGDRFLVYADGEKEEEREISGTEQINIVLTLRGSKGSGLIHTTKENLAIPAAAKKVPEEPRPPISSTRAISVVSVNLDSMGKQPVQAEMIASLQKKGHVRTDGLSDTGEHDFGFYEKEETEKDGSFGLPFSFSLWPLLLATVVTVMLDFFWKRRLIRKKEKERKFSPRGKL